MDRLDAIMRRMGQFVIQKQVAGEALSVKTHNNMSVTHRLYDDFLSIYTCIWLQY